MTVQMEKVTPLIIKNTDRTGIMNRELAKQAQKYFFLTGLAIVSASTDMNEKLLDKRYK